MPNVSDYGALTAEERYTRNVSFTMGRLEVPHIDMYEALAKETEMIAYALANPDNSLRIPNAHTAAKVWRVVEALRESSRLGGAVQNV